MKRYVSRALVVLFCLLYILLALPVAPVKTVQADGGYPYACILEDDVYFYTARDERQGLFLLPKTYYVKILETAPDYCKIEYLYDDSRVRKLVGYAKTSQLTFVDYHPTTPYLYHLIEVCYKLDDEDNTGNDSLNELKVTCVYYGDYVIGSKRYAYVLRDDQFGYILKPTDLTYPENDEYANRLPKPDDTPASSTTTSSDGASPAQIAILIALCLLVPVLAGLIVKSPRKPPYDKDD